MNHRELFLVLLLSVAILLFLIGAIVAFYRSYRAKRILEQMDRMLDQALAGNFDEMVYDETLLSSVESKLLDYLAASAVSAKNLGREKDAIKTLISDISHQTKTPVANVVLYAQLLSEQELSPEGQTCAAALNAQGEKLRFLIDALVKTSRLETGILTLHPKENPVFPLLENVRLQIMPKAKQKNISVTVKDTAALAIFDSKWTAEAIFNIVDNGVKYTPAGGAVTIETVNYELFCCIRISDNGIGIAEGDTAKIFGRFYRAASVDDSEGTGLGLYLARQIIGDQGGYIKVESELGVGSIFSLFLPTASAKG